MANFVLREGGGKGGGGCGRGGGAVANKERTAKNIYVLRRV
jgi:hypothetical protein